MEQHPIENLMKTTLENIKDMVDVNTIIGDAVHTQDGSTIIPISKVGFAFAAGGSDMEFSNKNYEVNKLNPFGGGAGAGVTIKPVGFLVVREDAIRLLPIDHNNTYEKIIDSIPQLIETFKGVLGKSDQSDKCDMC